MTTTRAAPPRSTTLRWPAAVAVLLVLAVTGALRLPALIAGATAAPSTEVATSFGVITLAGYELLDGPTADELGGVTHGIGGYVDSAHAMVRVHLTLSGNDVVVPRAIFSLRRPDGTVVAPDATTLPSDALPDGAQLDASLSFVVPRASGTYALVVRDGDSETTLPLGSAIAAPRAAPHQH